MCHIYALQPDQARQGKAGSSSAKTRQTAKPARAARSYTYTDKLQTDKILNQLSDRLIGESE